MTFSLCYAYNLYAPLQNKKNFIFYLLFIYTLKMSELTDTESVGDYFSDGFKRVVSKTRELVGTGTRSNEEGQSVVGMGRRKKRYTTKKCTRTLRGKKKRASTRARRPRRRYM